MLKRLGQPEPLGHPVAELLAIGAEARAWLGVLRSRLSQLTSLETATVDGAERERATVVLYERSLDRTAKILTDMARLDLEDRLVRVTEAQGEIIARVLIAAISRSEIPEEWQPRLREAVAIQLRGVQ